MADRATPASSRPRRPGRGPAPRTRPGRRRNLVVSVVVLAAVAVYAVVVPAVSGVDDRITDFASARQAPSWAHPFGTDAAGRDLFVRTAAGIRISLLIAALCAVLSTVLGVLAGSVSGLVGGRVDAFVMRLGDALNSLPQLVLGIVLVAMFRGNIAMIVLAVVLTHWVQVARIVRSEIGALRHSHFVEAAISSGGGRWFVIREHLSPAVLPQALVAVVLLLPHAVWHESTLSFLGFGLPPHRPSLGTLLEEARSSLLLGGWWTLAFPSLTLVVVTISVAAAGAALRSRYLPSGSPEVDL